MKFRQQTPKATDRKFTTENTELSEEFSEGSVLSVVKLDATSCILAVLAGLFVIIHGALAP